MRKISLVLWLIVILSAVSFAQSGIKGKVRSDNERSLSGVKVTAIQDGKEIDSTTTDNKGLFEMSLKPGTYNVSFEKSGFAGGVLYKVEVSANKIRDLGDRLILTTDRATQVILQGSVFNADGISLPGAKIEISKAVKNGGWEKVRTVYTGEKGEFQIRFPSQSSTFKVTAIYPNAEAVSKEVVVDGAGIYRTAITVNPKKD